jgi:UV excision repair protein RAD23
MAPEGEEGEEGEGGAGMGGMGGMAGMGDIAQIRERLLQNPAYLQQLLQELQTANPALYQLVQQNPQILLQILMGGAGGPAGPRPPHGGIQVTPEEKAAIDRV